MSSPSTTAPTVAPETTPAPQPGSGGTGDDVRHAFLVRRDQPLPPAGTILKTVCGTEAPVPADLTMDRIPANVCPLCAWVWEDSGLPH